MVPLWVRVGLGFLGAVGVLFWREIMAWLGVMQ